MSTAKPICGKKKRGSIEGKVQEKKLKPRAWKTFTCPSGKTPNVQFKDFEVKFSDVGDMVYSFQMFTVNKDRGLTYRIRVYDNNGVMIIDYPGQGWTIACCVKTPNKWRICGDHKKSG